MPRLVESVHRASRMVFLPLSFPAIEEPKHASRFVMEVRARAVGVRELLGCWRLRFAAQRSALLMPTIVAGLLLLFERRRGCRNESACATMRRNDTRFRVHVSVERNRKHAYDQKHQIGSGCAWCGRKLE